MGMVQPIMSEQKDIRIVQYSDDLAKDLAEMYNGWDDLWPGGYTQGVPYDEDRIKKQFGTMAAIAILIAIDTATNKPVGSCTLHHHWRDNDAAYVGTLGVSPEALNKKVGKKLLLRAIEISQQHGKTRVDLNTWPGNMRAVPLYKKVGMMWNPTGDGVQMESYIPGILEHPLTKPFFDTLPEHLIWYDVLQRDIVQAPDDFKEDGMEIFPYRFMYEDNVLSVVVDKHSRHITAIDRIVDGARIAVRCSVLDHIVLCGVPSKYFLKIENDTHDDIEIGVSISSIDAIHFDKTTKQRLVVKASSETVWEVPFTVSSDAPIHRRNLRTPTIDTEVELGGTKSLLRTGLVIKPAAEIRNVARHSRIAAGGDTTLPLSIISSASFPISGRLVIESSTDLIKVQPSSVDITVQPEGISGATIVAHASPSLPSGTHELLMHLELEGPRDLSLSTRRFRFPIYCLENGTVAISDDEIRLRKVVATSKYFASASYEGGILTANDSEDLFAGAFQLRSQIGPPFGLDSFRFAPREIHESFEKESLVLTMVGEHPERPLTVEDRVIFEYGTGIIIHQVWVTNTGDESHDFQLRVYGGGTGIGFTTGTKVLPLKERIIVDSTVKMAYGYPAISSSPSAFSEGWIAISSRRSTKGQFWDKDSVEEIRIGTNQLNMLQYPHVKLAPKERRMISQIGMAFGEPDWLSIQTIWQSRVAKEYPDMSYRPAPETHGIIDLSVDSAISHNGSDATAKVTFNKAIEIPLPVDIEVTVPEGWEATLQISEDGAQGAKTNRLENQVLQDSQEFIVSVSQRANKDGGFFVQEGTVRLRGFTDQEFPLHILGLGTSKGEVAITQIEDQGLKSYLVKNGVIEFKVSHEYGGCLYSLKNARGTELLISTFPTAEARPGGFLSNYYGGIQPIIWDQSFDEELTNALTNKETMEGKPVAVGVWKGVEISWVGTKQQSTRGVRMSVQYLTLPGCPLVLTRWIVDNTTESPLGAAPSFVVDPGFNGGLPNTAFRAEVGGRMTDHYQMGMPSMSMPQNNILWIHNEGDDGVSEGLALVHSDARPSVMGLAIESMTILGVIGNSRIMPSGEKRVIMSCFVVDPHSDYELEVLQQNLGKLVEE